MVDHPIYDREPYHDAGGRAHAVARTPRHTLVATSRVFLSGTLLSALGIAQWLAGVATATWANKMTGASMLAIGCLIATAALLYAEQAVSDGETSG